MRLARLLRLGFASAERLEVAITEIAALRTRVERLLARQEKAMAALDDLTQTVSDTVGVIDSGVAAINGLADKIDELIAAGNNDPALAALSSQLRAKADELAIAIADNPVPPTP